LYLGEMMSRLTLRVDCVTQLVFYDCRFGGFQRIETWQQAVAVGNLEERPNALGNADDTESAIGSLAGREHADHASQACRIHVGHCVDVNNHGVRGLLARNLLKIEQRFERERPGQFHDAGSSGAID
jgi:hypothetical protein